MKLAFFKTLTADPGEGVGERDVNKDRIAFHLTQVKKKKQNANSDTGRQSYMFALAISPRLRLPPTFKASKFRGTVEKRCAAFYITIAIELDYSRRQSIQIITKGDMRRAYVRMSAF